MEKVQDIFLNLAPERKRWQQFLTDLGLGQFPDREVSKINETIGIIDEEGTLLATGSLSENIIKFIAVCNKDSSQGVRFNQIVTELVNRAANRGIYHLFVFTKPKYSISFESVGFHLLVKTDEGALLEKGKPDIRDYLAALPRLKGQKLAAIVMNANPFTLGHYYLVEKAMSENDGVYVFVVSENNSLFTREERLSLVQKGLSEFSTVRVLLGGDYMVSYKTFPAYFIDSQAGIIHYQTELDARLFGKWIVPTLGLTSRYLGNEPLSETTAIYNQSLQKELSGLIKVKVIERQSVHGQVISATAVRQAIEDGQIETIKDFLPLSTYGFIQSNLSDLQNRIKANSL